MCCVAHVLSCVFAVFCFLYCALSFVCIFGKIDADEANALQHVCACFCLCVLV